MKINSLLPKAFGAFGFAAFAVSAQAGPIPMQEVVAPADDLGMTISVGYDSDYIFRGVNYGENLIWSEVAKSYTLTDTLSLDFGVWYGSLAGEEGPDGRAYDELDLISGLTYDLGRVQVGVGYIWYYFPHHSDHTGEIVASLSSSVGIVDLGLNYYYDHRLLDGHYIELTASTSYAITDRVSLEPGVSVAYEVDYNTSTNGFAAVGVGLALPIQLTSTATLTPYISANLPIDVLEDAGEDDTLYGGVSLSVSF